MLLFMIHLYASTKSYCMQQTGLLK